MQPKTSGLGITSMILGILGACLFWIWFLGPILGVLAIIFGAVAVGQINRSSGMITGKGMAIAGIVLGCVSIGIWLIIMLFFASAIMAAGSA